MENFVNSKSGKSFKSIDPSNEKEFAEISLAEEFEVNKLLKQLTMLFMENGQKFYHLKELNI